jgi:hypothetical protein
LKSTRGSDDEEARKDKNNEEDKEGEEDEEDKDTLHQVFKWLYVWNFRTVVQQLELCYALAKTWLPSRRLVSSMLRNSR